MEGEGHRAMGWAGRDCSDQRPGVCHISPLLRASLSDSFFWIAPLLMQAEMVIEGCLPSWTCLAHSTVPLMQQGICLSDSGWNKFCVSLELPGALPLCGTLGAQGVET